MKKATVYAVGVLFLMSSCGSYTASGAYTGSTIGSILGSAIGGITDGPRGSDVGTLLGMAGGAIIGAAIGNAADQAQQQKIDEYHQRTYEKSNSRYNQRNRDYNDYQDYNDSGFDPTNSGDDRIYEYNDADYTSGYNASKVNSYEPSASVNTRYNANLEIRNLRFVDDNMDNTLSANETCKIIFEIRNTSNTTLYDVQPIVEEISGNRQILVSPGVHVERIAPNKGIRYTAMVRANKRLKNGTARFRICAIQGDNRVISKIHEMNVRTARY